LTFWSTATFFFPVAAVSATDDVSSGEAASALLRTARQAAVFEVHSTLFSPQVLFQPQMMDQVGRQPLPSHAPQGRLQFLKSTALSLSSPQVLLELELMDQVGRQPLPSHAPQGRLQFVHQLSKVGRC